MSVWLTDTSMVVWLTEIFMVVWLTEISLFELVEKNKLVSCSFVAFLWNDKLFLLIHTADSGILSEREKYIISLIVA